MTKKILIVSLKVGAGHVKAAEALQKVLVKKYPRYDIRNIDFLEYATILSKKFYAQLYIDVVKYAPSFYNWLYHNIQPSSTTFRLIFDRINATKFKKYVFDFDPDLTICTHFVAANIINWWRKKYDLKTKTLLVITDYESHILWSDKDVDQYCVATQSVRREMIKFGIDKNKIKITGIPIDPKFTKKYDKKKIREKLKIGDGFTLSIFSGGFGMGPVEGILSQILNLKSQNNTLVVAGNNKELKEKLEDMVGDNEKIKIFGYVNNIEDLMAVSDVIISKPGGLTVSESLAIGIPLIISNPIPGQEEANAKFLLKNKAALRGDTPEKVAHLVEKVIKDKAILKKIKSNIKKIAQPDAADKIVGLVKKLL